MSVRLAVLMSMLATGMLLPAVLRGQADVKMPDDSAPLLGNNPWAAELPDVAFRQDVVSLAVIDLLQATPDALRTTLQALLDPQGFGQLERELPLANLTQSHEALTGAGVERVIFAMRGPDANGREPGPYLLLDVKAGTEEKTVNAALASAFGTPAEAQLAQKLPGDWMLISLDPRQKIDPAAPADAQQKQKLQTALQQAGSGAITMAFVPSQQMQQAVAQEQERMPPAMGNLASAVINSRSIDGAVTLGNQPRIVVVLHQADEATAQQTLQRWNEAAKELEQLAQQGPRGEEMAFFAKMLKDMQPRQQGADVAINMETPQLKLAAEAALPALARAREAAVRVRSMSNMRQLAIAVHMYATDHNGALPDSIDQLQPYLGEKAPEILTNPRTGQPNGYIYKKPANKMKDVKPAAETPMIWEADARGGIDPTGAIGYADGHVSMPRQQR
jgi:hypothetical protein